MAGVKVLVEVVGQRQESFRAFAAGVASGEDAVRDAERLLEPLAGLGLDIDEHAIPVPMLSDEPALSGPLREALHGFAATDESPDLAASSVVVPAEADRGRLEELQARPGVTIWPNSEIKLLDGDHGDSPGGAGDEQEEEEEAVDLARSRRGVDCRPFRDGLDVATIRELLGARRVWADGFRGQNVTVGILDDGIDGAVYPVSGGFSRSGAQAPGTARTDSHGCMCAADVHVAAPWARLYDYPFLGIPRSGGALAMFQAVLDDRRREGAPHLTNNSWGFYGVPPRELHPRHETHDPHHPVHRKVREVVASGCATFFAAGNCGEQCPSGGCDSRSVGPGRSIHASNSLAEVITIAAVNSRHERIGYSSQGPGMFEERKPDLACYTHFFGNFGPGRPGGIRQPFDNGTSAATPVATGVAALLLSAFPDLEPGELRQALVAGATRVGAEEWDPDYGRGIINAAASYTRLCWRTA